MPVQLILGGREVMLRSQETRQRMERLVQQLQVIYLDNDGHILPPQTRVVLEFLKATTTESQPRALTAAASLRPSIALPSLDPVADAELPDGEAARPLERSAASAPFVYLEAPRFVKHGGQRSEDLLPMIKRNREMRILRIERRATVWKCAGEISATGHRYVAIVFSVPQQNGDRDGGKVKTPRARDQSQVLRRPICAVPTRLFEAGHEASTDLGAP
jgi:hypothetical protein